MTESNILPLDNQSELPRNRVIIYIAGKEWTIDYSLYGLTFDSPESEFLEKLRGMIEENFGESIKDGSSWLYKTRKAVDSQNVWFIPNSTAGHREGNSLLKK